MAVRSPRPQVLAGERNWLWLGRCKICGTSVAVDDEFVRMPGGTVHFECFVYRLVGSDGRGGTGKGELRWR